MINSICYLLFKEKINDDNQRKTGIKFWILLEYMYVSCMRSCVYKEGMLGVFLYYSLLYVFEIGCVIEQRSCHLRLTDWSGCLAKAVCAFLS